MKYSLTANISNSSGGSRELTAVELQTLTDGVVVSGGVSLASSETILIECELGNRYNLDSLKYYHSTGGTVSVSVSESSGVWYSVCGATEVWGTEVLMGSYSPRWVKIEHAAGVDTPSVYEVELYNDDGEILFGVFGQQGSYGLDASGADVQAVQIFNSTTSARDISIFVEDTIGSDADSLLTVGLTSSGIFYGKHENGLNFPDDFSWDAGQHSGTITTISGHLTISGSTTSGTYYSPVFSMSPYEDNRFYWEYEDSGGSVDYSSSVDSESCFGIRHYHIPPTGGWTNGTLAGEGDSYWSISTGSLSFQPTPNNTILELRNREYVQFAVTLSGMVSPHIYKAGIESPVTISGVQPSSYKEIFMTSSSGTTSGSQTNLICWYKE